MCEPTRPETPSAKAQADIPRPPAWRTVAIELALTAGLVWACWTERASWETLATWLSAVLLTQATPHGSTVETAVKAIVGALKGVRK